MFNREALKIYNLVTTETRHAFKMEFKKDRSFYYNLVMNPCRNLDETRNRILRFITFEKNKMIQQRVDAPKSCKFPNRQLSDTDLNLIL